jgi:hypothetical protein
MTAKTTKPTPLAPRLAGQPRFLQPEALLSSTRHKQNLIRWPNERQLQDVSARLARMVRVGIRWEAKGDYFASGDLAYQIQEILRATEELFKKSQRLKR